MTFQKFFISIKAIDKNNLSEIEIKKRRHKVFYIEGTNLPEDLIITSAKLKGFLSKKTKFKKTS